MDPKALDTADNTFNKVRNLKNDLKTKSPKLTDSIDINSFNLDDLIPIIEEMVQSTVATNLPSTEEEPFMDTNQVAEMLRLEKQTIYGLVHQDKIPYEKVGQKLYFRKHRIMDWVLSGRKKEQPKDEEVENFFNTKHKYNK
jgi:excisionase family DNA binding protein